jgi:diphosphomevalonate decarboxylase
LSDKVYYFETLKFLHKRKKLKEAIAIAHPNFALVKYWGKNDIKENQPAMSSVSVTIDSLISKTKISKNSSSKDLKWSLNGREQNDLNRILPTINYLSNLYGTKDNIQIESSNNFPTAAGLASSASGIASLVTAFERYYDLQLPMEEKIKACMLGSGSAPRSLLGGFVLMDHLDHFRCSQILERTEWQLNILVCITSTEEKIISSRQAMEISRKTSPHYGKWLDINSSHIRQAIRFIKAKDLLGLGKVSEENCDFMHKVIHSSIPSITYKSEMTEMCIETVKQLRNKGHQLFYTIDAGPQVKIICERKTSKIIKDAILKQKIAPQIIDASIGMPAQSL